MAHTIIISVRDTQKGHTMRKIPVDAGDEYRDGYEHGMNNMLAMVKTAFAEHPEMTRAEIEQYIKDNL